MLAVLLALVSGPATGGATDFDRDVKPVLERSCYACHNPALRNADLDLTRFETEAKVLADPKTWEKVVEKTRTRQMPAAPFPPLVDSELELVTRWVETAFARQDEADPLVGLVKRAQARGERFEDGTAVAIQAILVSPDFLYRTERGRAAAAGGPGHVLTDHELASRLSYFLWVSMPDDTLLDLADEGRLSQPAVLQAQVSRMLRADKSAALVEAFAGQWLQFRALESVAPDRERFPDFDAGLRLAMRRETELLFLSLLREDASLLDLIDARYSFVNERLARQYGLPGVKGPEFRRVELADGRRGGILTHASVLTVSSYFKHVHNAVLRQWNGRLYVIAQAWNPGDFAVLEQVLP